MAGGLDGRHAAIDPGTERLRGTIPILAARAELCAQDETLPDKLLVHIASLVSGAIENAQLYDRQRRRVDALTGLSEVCADAVKQEGLEHPERYQAFLGLLARDAQDSLAAIEIVLAQSIIRMENCS